MLWLEEEKSTMTLAIGSSGTLDSISKEEEEEGIIK